MTTAIRLLARARSSGVDLSFAPPDRLRVTWRNGQPDPEFREALRRHKQELLELLRDSQRERYRALALGDLVNRLTDGWRWIHDRRPELFTAVCHADDRGALDELEQAMRIAVEAFETSADYLPRFS